MKTLGVAILSLMVASLSQNLTAQSQQTSSTPLSKADQAILRAWAEQDRVPEARIEGDRLILPTDDRNAMCAFLRVYRVERETPGSDTTRPAGYTTCVPASRFTIKRSVKPQSEQTPDGPARIR
jgi:hypothetical protein